MSEDLGLPYRLRRAARHNQASPDLIVELGSGEERFVLAVELKASAHRAAIAHAAERAKQAAVALDGIPVVAVPRLGRRVAAWLRQQGIGHVDLHGRAFLQGQGVLVDRQVADPHAPDVVPPVFPSLGSPFADRSSLVLRHLFASGFTYHGVRALASQLQLSPGLVSRVLRGLRDEGYVREEREGGGRLVSADLLLQDWVDFYRRRARKQRQRRFFMHARDPEAILSRLAQQRPAAAALPDWAISFHAGATLVAPYTIYSEVHVLLGGQAWEESVQAFRKRFALEPARDEANVILVQPSYRESWRYGVRRIRALPVVSDVQLYLDLHVYPTRGREQASRILPRILGTQTEAVSE
jgi:DNA-binding transcriptional ArsR family regulator